MTKLVLPARLAIQVHVWRDGALGAYSDDPLVFGVRTYARVKNDYHLGPIFTDQKGSALVPRSQLDAYRRATLSSGLMDYAGLEDAFSFVQILHWSPEDVRRAIETRSHVWNALLDGEEELFGSIDALIARLRETANVRYVPPGAASGHLRDEWTNSTYEPAYDYTIYAVPTA